MFSQHVYGSTLEMKKNVCKLLDFKRKINVFNNAIKSVCTIRVDLTKIEKGFLVLYVLQSKFAVRNCNFANVLYLSLISYLIFHLLFIFISMFLFIFTFIRYFYQYNILIFIRVFLVLFYICIFLFLFYLYLYIYLYRYFYQYIYLYVTLFAISRFS